MRGKLFELKSVKPNFKSKAQFRLEISITSRTRLKWNERLRARDFPENCVFLELNLKTERNSFHDRRLKI